jgi:hypothetical protein
MRKLLKNYTLTLVSLIATFLLEIIANFGLHLSDANQFIVIAVGLMASIVVASIDMKYRGCLSLYLMNG